MPGMIEEIVALQQRRSHGVYALGSGAAIETVSELEEALSAAERAEMLVEQNEDSLNWANVIVSGEEALLDGIEEAEAGQFYFIRLNIDTEDYKILGIFDDKAKAVEWAKSKNKSYEVVENLQERRGSPYEKRRTHETEASYSKGDRGRLSRAVKAGKTLFKPWQEPDIGGRSKKKAHTRSVRRSKSKEIDARLRGEDAQVTLPKGAVAILSAFSEAEGGIMSAPSIAEVTGLDKSFVRNELAVMAQEGVVARTAPSGDVWRITHLGKFCCKKKVANIS